jgi:hypothetical protein
MVEDYGNVVFDQNGFPLRDLEDRLSALEHRLMPVLKEVLSLSRIEPQQRFAVSMIVAMQCCRYPELYEKRLERGRELAIEMAAAKSSASLANFNARLQAVFPAMMGIAYTQAEFDLLQAASADRVEAEVEDIVYGDLRRVLGLNPNSVIDAAPEVAWQLGLRHWELVCAPPSDPFVLSDRPVPTEFNKAFSVVLGPELALVVDPLQWGDMQATVVSRGGQPGEVHGINIEAKARVHEWLCARTPF